MSMLRGQFGHEYNYEHFMLIDTMEMDDWVGFKGFIRGTIELEDSNRQHSDDNVEYLGKQQFGDCDIIHYGVDTTGWLPCLFAELMDEEEYKSCGGDHEDYELYKERMKQIIFESFNKLIGEVEDGIFRFQSSRWTSEAYSTRRLYP